MTRLAAGALSLELRPELGGAVGAFRLARADGPFDLMRPLSVPAGRASDALYAGMFPMLPFANCIRDNRFGFAGRDYAVKPNMAGARLNYHGSGWQSPWSVARADERSAELLLTAGRVDDVYAFEGRQVFTLDADGLTVETEVTNRGERTMPFSFGQHPWFPTRGRVLTRFTATRFWHEDEAGHADRLLPILLDADFTALRAPPSEYRNVCYAGWERRAEIVWPDAGVLLDLSADPVFGHLMFHVPPGGQPVFCLEPQSNAPCGFDGLEQGRIAAGVHILAPGASVAGTLRFSVRTNPN